MRFRNVFLLVGGLLVLIILLLSDPDGGLINNLPFGASTLTLLISLVVSILYIGMLHAGRKALLDYINLEDIIKKAVQTSDGAGLVTIGIGLMMISIAIVVFAASR